MKIVYFGFNALSSCLDLLIHHENSQIIAVYTGDESPHTDQIIQLAQQNNITIKTQQPTKEAMELWLNQGVECFICAEYPHKIPIPKSLKYSVNIHPTLLPEGRGKTPLPHILLKYPSCAGVSLHKISDQLDQGDILLSKAITIDEQESFDSLQTKVFLEAPRLLHELLTNWQDYFNHATQQLQGSNWPSITSQQQSINWSMSTETISIIARAFSSLGVAFELNNKNYYFTSAQCMSFEHGYQAGEVIIFDEFKLTIATLDGFIIIPRTSLFEY